MAKNPSPRDWLKALGALTINQGSREESETKIAAYVPLLEMRFDLEAFSGESLEYVASHCKFFPAYAEITEHLGKWWQENRPRPVLISHNRGLSASTEPYSALPDPEQVKIRETQSDEILRKHGMHSLSDIIKAREART